MIDQRLIWDLLPKLFSYIWGIVTAAYDDVTWRPAYAIEFFLEFNTTSSMRVTYARSCFCNVLCSFFFTLNQFFLRWSLSDVMATIGNTACKCNQWTITFCNLCIIQLRLQCMFPTIRAVQYKRHAMRACYIQAQSFWGCLLRSTE